MKCYICDKTLTPEEVKHNPTYGRGEFDPCFDCLSVIDEVFNDDDEDEITAMLLTEGVLDEHE